VYDLTGKNWKEHIQMTEDWHDLKKHKTVNLMEDAKEDEMSLLCEV
jgi:hypothetical protein